MENLFKVEYSQLVLLKNEDKLNKFKITITLPGDYHYVCIDGKRKIKYVLLLARISAKYLYKTGHQF